MRKITLLAAALCMTASVALAAVPFDKVLPENTLGMLRARNVPELRAKAQAQPAMAFFNEPAMQKFLERPLARLNEELAKAEGKAGVTLADVAGLLRGEAALCVTTDEAMASPEVLLLIDVADQGARAMEVVGLLVSAASKADADAPAVTQVEQMIDGVRFMTVRAADADAAEEPKLCYGVAGDVLVIGGPLAAITRQVGFLKAPPEKALANNPAYVAAMAKLPAGADIQGFVNIQEILAVVQAQAPDPAVAAQWVNALGLKGLTAAALGAELGKEYNTTCAFLASQGAPQGIAKILMPPPGPLHTGAEVAADVNGFLSVRLDPVAIYDEVERMLITVEPMAIASLNDKINQMAQATGQPFSLRNDALTVFGPRMGYYSLSVKPYNVPENHQQVFMVDISGKAAFQALLEKLQKLAPGFLGMFQPRDYMGYQLYVMTMPDMGMPPEQMAAMPKPAFVATDRELLISASAASLEAHLRRINAGGPTLQDRPEFKELFKRLPVDGRVFISYSDARPQVETFVASLKEGAFDFLLNQFRQDPDVAEVLDLFDFSLLPEPEVVSKYITPTATVGVVQPEGLLFMSTGSANIGAGAGK